MSNLSKANNPVTSIVFSTNRGMKERFVLAGHRDGMIRMEDKMEKAECEPLLVVSKTDPCEWWVDDLAFLGDLLKVDELMIGVQVSEEPVVQWLEKMLSLRAGESVTESFDEIKAKYGLDTDLVLTAMASTMPCDEKHGLYTNDCEPINL